MGGIGKTTLARNAYNDAEIKTIFEDKMIWVCVPDPFDIGRIANETIKQLTRQTPAVISLELQLLIDEKKFVNLTVVVTMQNEEVAKMIGDTNKICMDKLAEEDCWLLLREIALSNRMEQLALVIRQYGEKKVKLVMGVDGGVENLEANLIAIKAVLTDAEMRRWNEEAVKLWLEDLKDVSYDMDSVLDEWNTTILMSELDQGGNRAESSTSQITKTKVWCSILFSCFNCTKLSPPVIIYRHHIAEEIQSLNQKLGRINDRKNMFGFRSNTIGDTIELRRPDFTTSFLDVPRVDLDIRHLNLIYVSSSVTPTFSNLKKKNLHTLMVTCDSMLTGSNNSLSSCMFPYDLLDLKRLKTLILKGESMKIPVSIGDLIHLRYFSIRSYDIIDVPPTIGNLFNLQTLKFYCCITELPEEVGELMNLRHLHLIKGCTKSLPKSIWALTRLQTLDIGGSIKVGVLGDIRILNNLCIIRLEGLGKEEHKEEAKEAQLLNKKALVHLHLKFDKDSSVMDTHEIVLDSLQPHHENLKSLRIEEYCGLLISPSWMLSLTNLRNLDLYGCFNCITLPPLGKLPCLESLCIDSFPGLKKIGSEFLGEEKDSKSLFPKLEKFEINFADSLEEWVGVAGWTVNGPLKIMPCLESLEMSFCGLLRTLPDFLRSTPLKNLVVAQCDILEKSCEMEKIRHLRIRRIKERVGPKLKQFCLLSCE
ncbi:hypothetical protein G4B88_013233 [Cannabis sativa]|uniref:NB-ARC domain-containing protein n=1 Tax=Cannabis sativa TaxID=3483 RepID=A0A7J6GZM5_CANSA|nr:hypothetical protein G4B88_013233 [Cannabis sativa]